MNPGLQRHRDMQDLTSALERIVSRGEAMSGIHGEPPMDCSIEDVKEIRGFARLALLSSELPHQVRERLSRVLQTLEGFDSPP